MQGSGHSAELPEFKEHWTLLSDIVWILGGPLWSQELDSMILMGHFQLGMLYDSNLMTEVWVKGSKQTQN